MPSLLTYLRTISLYAFFSFLLFGATATLAHAASYYVEPNGGGSTCSSASPCSLNEGLGRAGAGDEIVLLDGTYRQFILTKRDGSPGNHIVIRAANTGKAIVQPPMPPPHRATILRLEHSNITVRGIVFDGTKRVHNGVRIGTASGTKTI